MALSPLMKLMDIMIDPTCDVCNLELWLVADEKHVRGALQDEWVLVGVGVARERVGAGRCQVAPSQAHLHHRQPGRATQCTHIGVCEVWHGRLRHMGAAVAVAEPFTLHTTMFNSTGAPSNLHELTIHPPPHVLYRLNLFDSLLPSYFCTRFISPGCHMASQLQSDRHAPKHVIWLPQSHGCAAMPTLALL